MNEHFISFPKIGIEFEISPVAFKIFGQEIYFYGIVIALGFALALIFVFKNANPAIINNPKTQQTDIILYFNIFSNNIHPHSTS